MSLYEPFTAFLETSRKLFKKRVKDGQLAFLGDKTDPGARTDVPDAPGFLYARFPGVPDANGNATFSAPFLVRAGDAAFQNYPGASVYVAVGYNGELEIVSANYQELTRNGINTATLNPLHQQSKWVYKWQLTIGLASAVANSVNSSFLVTVKKYLRYSDNVFASAETGEQADKVDLSAYMPATDMHRYATVWLDAYTGVYEVTTSTTQSLFTPVDDTDLQETVTERPPDAVPHKTFYLANNAGTVHQNAVSDRDVRQFLNTPHVWGFPNPVAYRERIHPDRQQLFVGSLVVTGSLEVLGSLVGLSDEAGSSGGSSGAPDDATYITQTPAAGLTGEQALSALATGLMKSTTGTGVVSTAVAETDYVTPSGAGTLANKILSQLHLLIGGFKGIFTHANSADRTYTLPNATGTVALTSDIPAAGITQLTGDVTAGPGSGSQVATIAAGAVTYTKLAEDATPFVCDYRLSCANVTDTLVDASGSEMFLAKWKGDRITLYDGRWYLITPTSTPSFNSQTSQAMTVSYTNGSANVTTSVAPDQNIFPVGMRIPSIPTGGAEAVITAWTGATSFTISPVANATGSVAALAVKWQEDKNYDFFAYLTGTSLDVELTCRAWTNNTTRAVALDELNGRWHMDSAPEYLYVGSGYNASGGSGMVDTVLKREIWSHFNQRRRVLSLVSGLNTFNDTVTSIHQYNSSTVQQVRVMIGLPNLSTVDLEIMAYGAIAGQRAGVGVNSTTTFDGVNLGQRSSASAFPTKWDKLMPDIGLHTLSFNVAAAASGQWFGVNNSFAAGMSGGIMA